MKGWRGQRFAWIMTALLIAGPGMAAAQSSSAALSGIAHVAIRVSNLEASRAFFHKLGFEEAFAMNKGGQPTEAFFKINDRQFIELYPRKNSADSVGFMHICFETADIRALRQNYIAHGLSIKPVVRAGAGNLLFTLQGPEEPGPASDLRPDVTQNIEYTQYMPGSRHTLDRGKHLGTNRIATQLIGVGIPMQDPKAAKRFYEDKLSFSPAMHPLKHGALTLPGTRGEQIEFLGPSAAPSGHLHFWIIFTVANLRTTKAQLRKLGFAPKRHGGALVIDDPDGDAIMFCRARGR